MTINHVQLKIGVAEVCLKGTHDNLVEVAFELLDRVSKISQVETSMQTINNPNSGKCNSDGLSEGNTLGSKVKPNSYKEITVTSLAECMDCDSGRKLTEIACVFLHHVKKKIEFNRSEILSTMKTAPNFYKDNYSKSLSRELKALTNECTILLKKKDYYSLSNKALKSWEKNIANF